MKDTAPSRPRRVDCAVLLLVAAAALNVCVAPIGGGDYLMPSLVLMIVLILGAKTLQGRLWTRECFLVMCALQFMGVLMMMLMELTVGRVFLTQAVPTLLYIAGCQMLFSRQVFDWFSQMGVKRERVQG